MTAATPWVIPGLVPAGLSVLEGAWNAGKSSIALGVLLAVASGGRALGRIPAGQPRDVLYVALRDSDRPMSAQCRDVLGADPVPARFHFMTAVKPGAVAETLTAWIEDHPEAALILIDPLSKLYGPRGQAETPMAVLGAKLKEVADSSSPVAVVVSVNDVGGGAQDILGAGATLSFERYTARTGALQLTGNDMPKREYPLTVDRAGAPWTIEGSYPGPAASDFPAWEQEVAEDPGSPLSFSLVRDLDGDGTAGWRIEISPELAANREAVKRLVLDLNATTTRWFFESYGFNLPGGM